MRAAATASPGSPEPGARSARTDNAIADAVKEYAYGHKVVGEDATLAVNVRHGSFVHELRNPLNTATLAFALVRGGRVTPDGATGQVVDRSLSALGDLIERAVAETRRSR